MLGGRRVFYVSQQIFLAVFHAGFLRSNPIWTILGPVRQALLEMRAQQRFFNQWIEYPPDGSPPTKRRWVQRADSGFLAKPIWGL